MRSGDASPVSRPKSLAAGDGIVIQGIDWRHPPQTLVLAISSTNCDACAGSMPFYRALLNGEMRRGWQAVVVSDDPTHTMATYLNQLGITSVEVRRLDLNRAGIRTVPTVLIVNQDGRVHQQWIGSLSASEEDDIGERLGVSGWSQRTQMLRMSGSLPFIRARTSIAMGPAELSRLLKSGDDVNLLDVRDRSDFRRKAVKGAYNIPLDELATRVPHELVPGAPILLFCDYSAACVAEGLPNRCSAAMTELQRVGIQQARILRDTLAVLETSGIQMQGTLAGSPPPTSAAR
jgi:hypothetical protein